jgi:putative DNA primase/helicase
MDATARLVDLGIIVDRPLKLGVWQRYPTKSHPHKRNASVKYLGHAVLVQDHATMDGVATLVLSAVQRPDISRVVKQAAAEQQKARADAARRACALIKASKLAAHPYLEKKGFNGALGLVYDGLLIVPMYVGGKIVGCQTIDADGEKKFMRGQASAGAYHDVIGGRSRLLCEGYATALTLAKAAHIAGLGIRVTAVFSAGNLSRVQGDYVAADNDASGTGQKAAEAANLPYMMPPTVGDDWNDHAARFGIRSVARALSAMIKPLI